MGYKSSIRGLRLFSLPEKEICVDFQQVYCSFIVGKGGR